MNQIEKALSDYLGDMCGMRLKPHALTGLAKAAIAAMPVQAEPVAWMYERESDVVLLQERRQDRVGGGGMSELMTAIKLPGFTNGDGYAEYGNVPADEMIQIIRRRAENSKRWADAVLAANDADFRIEQYRGVHVQKNRVVVQEGKLQ